LVPIPEAAILEQARKRLGLSMDDLWMAYFEIGGKADPVELEAFLLGTLRPDAYQYNVIAHALNEQFVEQDQNHPVPYAHDGRT
jgi:hypothetical protein